MNLDAENLRPAPDFGTTIDSSFIRGLALSNDNMIIMLNIDGLLASCELVALDKLAHSEESQEGAA